MHTAAQGKHFAKWQQWQAVCLHGRSRSSHRKGLWGDYGRPYIYTHIFT